MERTTSPTNGLVSSFRVDNPDLPRSPSYTLSPGTNCRLVRPSPSPLWVLIGYSRYRNINLSPIGYAFRPRLRVRLTLGGFTVPRKPWVCGEQDSHLLSRYLFRHNHFQNVQASLPSPFTPSERSPTPARCQPTPCKPQLRLCT